MQSMPSSSDPVPRPRGRPAAEASQPAVEVDPRLLELTHAIEDLHVAAKALHLAPLRVEWQEPDGETSEIDPERLARQQFVTDLVADYEGLRAGPIPLALPSIPAPVDPDSYLVGNLVRPGTTVMLAGPPGAAKSWASRQLALSAGAGLDIFLDRYEVGRPLNVLVVDEDNGPDEEWRRDASLLDHLSLTRDTLDRVYRVSLAGVQLDRPEWQRWLRGQIRLRELDLVILDPISEMHGGKELREDPAFRSMLAFLKRLKVDFPRTAVVIVHHTRKPAASERQSHRGLEDVRGQWGQTPDVIVVMSPLGERRTKWEVHKRVPFSSLILEQVAEGQHGEGGLHMVADAEIMRDQRAETDDKVLGAIDAGAANVQEIVLGTGLSNSGVYKAVARLSHAGLISRRPPFTRLQDPTDDEVGA